MRYWLFALIVLAVAFFLSSGLAQEEALNFADGSVNLVQGENKVIFDKPIYVRDLVTYYPEIESVSYHNEFLNKQFGFVNVFGGIGSNFLIIPGIEYEIFVSEDVEISLN